MTTPYFEIKNEIDPNRYNCVFFVRSLIPRLPYGLWTLRDKIKIINSCTPKKGYVAIISTGIIWGHVAVVRFAGSKHVTIREANFKKGKITERHGRPVDLKILGYFNPNPYENEKSKKIDLTVKHC